MHVVASWIIIQAYAMLAAVRMATSHMENGDFIPLEWESEWTKRAVTAKQLST